MTDSIDIPAASPARGGNRARCAETWARAGADYQAGQSAAEVCERYDLALSTFRAKAKENGWRRRDQPDPEPPELTEDSDDTPPGTPAELADLAWRQASRAVRRGSLIGARGWTRLTQDLRGMAKLQAEAARAAVQRDAAEAEAARRVAAMRTYLDAAVADGVYPAQARTAFWRAQTRRGDLPVYGQEEAPPRVSPVQAELDALERSLDEDERESALDRGDALANELDDLDGLDWRDDGWGVVEAKASRPETLRDEPPPPATPTPPPLRARGEETPPTSLEGGAAPLPNHTAPLPLPRSGGGVAGAGGDGGAPSGGESPEMDDSDGSDLSVELPSSLLSSRPERSKGERPTLGLDPRAEPQQTPTAPPVAVPDRASPVREDNQGMGGGAVQSDDAWPPPGLPTWIGLTVVEHQRRWRDQGLVPWV